MSEDGDTIPLIIQLRGDAVDNLTLQDLLDASRAGGASSLAVVTEMSPAAGSHAGVLSVTLAEDL